MPDSVHRALVAHTISSVLKKIQNPPNTHRSMPLWVWNGEMTEQRITEMLEQFAAVGMGGVYVHPRPGLITEYLGEKWFELWSFALGECKRLGLICNVYDENSYPAGFAGGHVPSRIPGAAAQYAWAEVQERAPLRWTGELLTAYRMNGDKPGSELPVNAVELNRLLEQGERLLTVELRTANSNRWTADFPYVDLTRPEVAREFIATTYDAYADRFGGEFGKSVRAFFCDEPLMGMVAAGNCGATLPLSRYILAEFSKEHRYDLIPSLPLLFIDQDNSYATRFDYFSTIHRLFTRNFIKPLYDWCEERGVTFTGHYMEHEWPDPFFHPNTMDAYRWMHMPGIDLLAPQFDFAEPEKSGLYLMTVKEAASVAHQMGRERVMCETHGVGGHEATFEDFKRLSDWLMVHGVNYVVQHLSFQTIAGARKQDHPQTFSDHSPWWSEYGVHAEHVARLSVAITSGVRISRLLVLQPSTTGWIYGNPAPQESNREKRQALRESQGALVQWLSDHQVDFDLGDELIMRDMASVTSLPRLRVGKAEYQLILVPAGMENFCESTLVLLTKWLEAGGFVLALGDMAGFVNGRRDSRVAELAQRFPDHWVRYASLEELQVVIDRRLEPLVITDSGDHLPPLISYHARNLDNRVMLHLLVNSGHDTFSGNVRFPGNYVYLSDTENAALRRVSLEAVSGYTIAPVVLHSAGHALLFSSDDELVDAPRAQQSNWTRIQPGEISAERTSPNVLALDFCDLVTNGRTYPGMYVTHANKKVWQEHGFDADPWDRAVQFRRNTIDWQFAGDSGFLAIYRFSVQTDAHPQLQGSAKLALENPHLYTVQLNGSTLDFADGARWLDETVRAVDVGALLRPGENEVRLSASPFHPLCEIDRIYLLGDFALVASQPGFEVAPVQQLSLGNWAGQGLGMYNGSVAYRGRITLSVPANRVRVTLPGWNGSIATVFVDDERVGEIAWAPWECAREFQLAPGEHEVRVEVVGTLKNLLGPHFCKQPLAGRWNVPGAWEDGPAQSAPGSDYELLPYGLTKPFIVEVAPA